MPFEIIILGLAFLLIFGKLFGEITERLGFTSLVGQVIAGIMLGPILGIVAPEEFLQNIMTLGIIFVLFLAGLGVRFEEMKDDLYTAVGMATAGGVLSFIFGFLVGYLFFNDIIIGISIGIVFISTSNSIVFTLLRRMGEMKTRAGRLIVMTSASDDVVSILALSFFTFFIVHGSVAYGELFKLFLIAIGFYFVMLTAGSRLIDKIISYTGNLIDEQILFSIPLAIVFFLAFLSENIGLGIATGAFLGGMIMSKNKFTDNIIIPKVKVIGDGFFIPIFYSAIGAFIVLQGIDPLLIVAITLAAVLGKYIATIVMCRFYNIRKDERTLVALSMIPRGDYNLAVAQIALTLGVFGSQINIYSSIVFSIVITIIITPILLKIVTHRNFSKFK